LRIAFIYLHAAIASYDPTDENSESGSASGKSPSGEPCSAAHWRHFFTGAWILRAVFSC